MTDQANTPFFVKVKPAWRVAEEIRNLRGSSLTWKRVARIAGLSPEYCRQLCRPVADPRGGIDLTPEDESDRAWREEGCIR